MTKKWLLATSLKEKQLEQIQNLYADYEMLCSQENAEALAEVEWVVGWNKELTEQLEAGRLPALKWVQVISAGINNYPLQSFKGKGIYLTNGSGMHSEAISEYVIGVLLTHMRGLRTAILNQQKQKWEQMTDLHELKGKTMLIVGSGHIGKRLAQLAKAFGMTVIGVNRSGNAVAEMDRTVKMEDIQTVIGDADVVVDILPQTDLTEHVFDAVLFGAMKKGVLFVNVGRGTTVDNASLLGALEDGTVAFAALDVFDAEPLAEDSPLWRHPNILITPHFSGVVEHFKDSLFEIVQENAESFLLQGKPSRNVIDFEKNY